jgi:hypothetical protein
MRMSAAEIWEAWAPADVLWSQWAKPVLIAQLVDVDALAGARLEWPSLDLSALPISSDRTALVVNLPGAISINYGLALAKRGFRPVPLFNGCVGRAAIVPTEPLQAAMVAGAADLRAMAIDPAAPPAFLLDSHRMRSSGKPRPGEFDNRWMTFPQDFPSADLLKSRQIEVAMLLQDDETVGEDLAHVLLRWKDAGIRILLQSRSESSKARPLNILRPPSYRALWHRALAALGFKRNSAGGFGSLIPEPAPEGSYGGGGFGIG